MVYIITYLAGILFLLLTSAAAGPKYEVVEQLSGVPDGWIQGVAPSPSTPMKFWLAIHHDNRAGFEQKVIEMSTPGHHRYGRHLKRDEVRAFLRPSDQASTKVIAWLKSEHVPSDSIEVRGDWITFTVPLSQAESIMRTDFHVFRYRGSHATQIRTLEYSVPEDIHPYLQLIQPTTRFGRLKTQQNFPSLLPVTLDIKDLDGNCSKVMTPDCLRQLYGIFDTKATPDPANTLGISGYLDQYGRFGDLGEFMKVLAPNDTNANFSVVSINGGFNLQNSFESSTEASLDIQYAIAVAYDANAIYYTTAGRGPFVPESGDPSTEESSNEPYLEQLQYLLDLPDDQLPAVLTTSYGEDEQTVPEEYMRATCSLFAQLGARGVSPVFPASCPFVTSVGGTEGLSPERAIDFSGGGFSDIFARPSYQNASVESYLETIGDQWNGLYNPDGRGIPDVAAQARNYAIRDHGVWLLTAGTSAAAPVFAAIVSRLNAARLAQGKPKLGFLNPWLYSLNQTGFTDIVDGGSVGCDGTTGPLVPSRSPHSLHLTSSPHPPKMANDLRTVVSELHNALSRNQFDATNDLLSRGKRALLLQNALIPTPSTPAELIALAREVLELGALASIRQTDAPTFTRYYQQLQPFYDLERESTNAGAAAFQNSQRSKITGLYLLLLLSMGDSTSFHTVLEGLVEEASLKGKSVEDDPFIKYPVELERNLMEGSYDKVWRETNSERVPSEDFALFSNVLVGTIRSEIADCSEKAYPSLPISNAKNLLFLESEGAVIEFAQQRGWVLRDGRIYFPVEPESAARSEKDILVASGTIIENAIGYARELETIV
ncbi:hypothetical protein BO71DRAFT_453603 [Aspergillus ellipticus CBS 707.79]|uniref:tripeptidyl-peptidase II n=1 Tax=Aspergillus ellipticus CBS 707.79 TaxID=1448320 RepID=A0A319CV81_9EURO|nr:hypothetical protein BO71DRAFT_453603 [Aspergillus ellipticus CBS 707.79]